MCPKLHNLAQMFGSLNWALRESLRPRAACLEGAMKVRFRANRKASINWSRPFEWTAATSISGVQRRSALPGSAVSSHRQIREFITNAVESKYHPSRTCCYGTRRHVDCSPLTKDQRIGGEGCWRFGMSNVTSSNLNAAVITIAEKLPKCSQARPPCTPASPFLVDA